MRPRTSSLPSASLFLPSLLFRFLYTYLSLPFLSSRFPSWDVGRWGLLSQNPEGDRQPGGRGDSATEPHSSSPAVAGLGAPGWGGTWPRGQACISRTRSPVWGGHAAKLPPGKRIQCGGVTSSHVPTRDDWSSTCVPPLSHWKSRVAGGRTPSSGSPMASRSRAPCGSGTPTEGTNRDADRFAVLFFKP